MPDEKYFASGGSMEKNLVRHKERGWFWVSGLLFLVDKALKTSVYYDYDDVYAIEAK